MKSSSLLDSFRYAVEGVVHVFRTQRHMRFHFFMVVLVLTLAKVYRLNRTELLVLFFSICFVLITEMVNTAVEAVIDMITQSYHPLAKHAKDVTAGAVLIASINAVVVGYVLFLDDARIQQVLSRSLVGSPPPAEHVAVMEAVILLIIVAAVKALGQGKQGRKNVISGQTALGFSLATVTVLVSQHEVALIAMLVLLLAALLAQSCLERGLQNFRAVFTGAILGMCLPVILLRLIP